VRYILAFAVTLLSVACLDPDPCSGPNAEEFAICAAKVTNGDADTDSDTDADTDSDTDSDTDTVPISTGETGVIETDSPPETGDTSLVVETGDTGPPPDTGVVVTDTGPPIDTGPVLDTSAPTDTADTGIVTDTGLPIDTGDTGIVIGSDPNVDDDGDGLAELMGDCDDAEPLVRAGFAEICDGLDNDCDANVDDGVELTFYEDSDLDGFGDDLLGLTEVGCAPSVGFSAVVGDCDDGDNATYPGAPEPCVAGPDRNCDGSTAFQDADSDGWISCAECDDGNGSVFPNAPEVCNLIDDDCDSEIDEGVQLNWYLDFDLDGYGNPFAIQQACTAPLGYIADATDCDDSRPNVHPGLAELCDADNLDEDCDGAADDLDSNVAVKNLWLQDADADGFGNEFVDTRICDNPPANFILADSNGDGDEYNDPHDCDDTSLDVYPGAPIGVCDTADTGASTDFNCDGTPDCP
jgi:hypothetical protein